MWGESKYPGINSKIWQYLVKLEIYISYKLGILLLGIYLESCSHISTGKLYKDIPSNIIYFRKNLKVA